MVFNLLNFKEVKSKIHAAFAMILGVILLMIFGRGLEWYVNGLLIYSLYIVVFILWFGLVDKTSWKSYVYPFLFILGLMSGLRFLGVWFVLLVALGIPIWRLWKYRFALLYAIWLFINDKTYRDPASVTMLAVNVFLRTESMAKSWRGRNEEKRS